MRPGKGTVHTMTSTLNSTLNEMQNQQVVLSTVWHDLIYIFEGSF